MAKRKTSAPVAITDAFIEDARREVANAKAELKTLPSWADVENTPRAQDAWHREHGRRLGRYSGLKASLDVMERWAPELQSTRQWLATLADVRKEIEVAILALPGHAAQRTEAQAQQLLGLTTALLQIDRGVQYQGEHASLCGVLSRALRSRLNPTWDGPRDPWAYGHGAVAETKERIEDIESRLADARAKWDAALAMREPAHQD